MLFLSKIGKFAFYFPKISCIYHVYFKLHTGLTKNWVKIGKNVKFSSKNGGILVQIQRFCTYIFLFTVQRLYSYHIYFFKLWNYIYIYSYLKSLCTVYVLYRTSLWFIILSFQKVIIEFRSLLLFEPLLETPTFHIPGFTA